MQKDCALNKDPHLPSLSLTGRGEERRAKVTQTSRRCFAALSIPILIQGERLEVVSRRSGSFPGCLIGWSKSAHRSCFTQTRYNRYTLQFPNDVAALKHHTRQKATSDASGNKRISDTTSLPDASYVITFSALRRRRARRRGIAGMQAPASSRSSAECENCWMVRERYGRGRHGAYSPLTRI